MRFLVTAAGAGPAISVIKAIKRLPQTEQAHVVAVDMTRDSAGLHLADESVLVPAANSPDFSEVVLEIALAHSIDLVIPILDLEVPVLGAARSSFVDHGITVAIDTPEVTTRALNKRKASELCRASGIRQPEDWAHPQDAPADAYPIIGKPIHGTGSRGSILVSTPGDHAPEGDGPMIWQRFIEGPEYSIDMWGDPRSELFVAVPRWRRRVRGGQMVFGETVDDADLLQFARSTALAFQTTEVACLQVIREGDGHLSFIELNPRYGTGVSLSIAAGVPFPFLQWLRAFQPERLAEQSLGYEPGLQMIRYWEEHFYR
jgi:carbamoyl-phosphate synthase large subunit